MDYGNVVRFLDSTLDLFDVSSHEFKVCQSESSLRVECQQSWEWMEMNAGEEIKSAFIQRHHKK